MRVTGEVGRANLTLADFVPRAHGSQIQLDGYDHGPVDILVTAKVVARGELVTIDPSDAVPRTSVAKPG